MSTTYSPIKRICRIDGWRSYAVPRLAVVGASDTGTWSDSPCPTPDVTEELKEFIRDVLKPAKIKVRQVTGMSSNVFCAKRWVCVPEDRFDEAAKLSLEWLNTRGRALRFIHDAELTQCKQKESVAS